MKLKIGLTTLLFAFGVTMGLSTPAQAKTKKHSAKQQCLAENPNLKGKKLKACIKRKTAKSKKKSHSSVSPGDSATGVGTMKGRQHTQPMHDDGPGAGHESDTMPQMTPPPAAEAPTGASANP